MPCCVHVPIWDCIYHMDYAGTCHVVSMFLSETVPHITFLRHMFVSCHMSCHIFHVSISWITWHSVLVEHSRCVRQFNFHLLFDCWLNELHAWSWSTAFFSLKEYSKISWNYYYRNQFLVFTSRVFLCVMWNVNICYIIYVDQFDARNTSFFQSFVPAHIRIIFSLTLYYKSNN